MTMYANKTCEELQEALSAARASVESPRMRTTTDMNDIIEQGSPSEPGANQPDLMKEIEDIEQAMREAGCPEA